MRMKTIRPFATVNPFFAVHPLLLLSLGLLFLLGLNACGDNGGGDDEPDGDTETAVDGDEEIPCIYNCDDDDDNTLADGDTDGDSDGDEDGDMDDDQPPADGDEDCDGPDCGFEHEEEDWEPVEQRECERDEDCLSGEYCDENGQCQSLADGDEELDDEPEDEYADYELCEFNYPVCDWTPDCPEGHYCDQTIGCCVFDCRRDEDCPGENACCMTLYGLCTDNEEVCNGGDEDEEIIECNSCADCPQGTYCDFNSDICLPGDCCLDTDCPQEGYWCDQGVCRSADSEITPYGRIRVNLCLQDLATPPDQITVQLREWTESLERRSSIQLNAKEVEPVSELTVVREESAAFLDESGCFQHDFLEVEEGHYFITYYLNQPPGDVPRAVYDWSGNFHYQMNEETCQFVLDPQTGRPVPILDGIVLDYANPATTYYTVNIDKMVTNPLQQGTIQVEVVKGASWSEPVTVELFENAFPTEDDPFEPMLSYRLDALESGYLFTGLRNGRYMARAKSRANGRDVYDYYSIPLQLNNCDVQAHALEGVAFYFGHEEQDLGSIEGTVSFSAQYDPDNLEIGLYTTILINTPDGTQPQYLLVALPVWGEADLLSNLIDYSFPNVEEGTYTLLGNYVYPEPQDPPQALRFVQSQFLILDGIGNDTYDNNVYLGVPNPNLGSISGMVRFSDFYDNAMMTVHWYSSDSYLSGSRLGSITLSPDTVTNEAPYSIANLEDGSYWVECQWFITGPSGTNGFDRRGEEPIVIDRANGQQDILNVDFLLE